MRIEIIVLVLVEITSSAARADDHPTPPPVHDTIQAVKRQLEDTGPSSGRWVDDARKRVGEIAAVSGVSKVFDTKCFRSGCYATVDYVDASYARPTHQQIIEKLRAWKSGIFVSGIDLDSTGQTSSLVVLASDK